MLTLLYLVPARVIKMTPFNTNFAFPGRETGGEAKMGLSPPGKAAQGHRAGMSRGLCPLHHGEEARHVRPLKPRPEGQDEEDRLSPTGGQGEGEKKRIVSNFALFKNGSLFGARPQQIACHFFAVALLSFLWWLCSVSTPQIRRREK